MCPKALLIKPFLRPSLWLGALVAVGSLVLPGRLQAANETLDQAVEHKGQEIVRFLRDHHYQNVGVLKFLVQKGDQKPSDNVGTLNLLMADRLEVALILANPDESLGIIHQASAVAKTSPRADHRTPEGRKALFEIEDFVYAWQNLVNGEEKKVRADGFLAGTVHVRPSQGATQVDIVAYDRRHDGPVAEWKLTAPLDARTLAEAGYSYRTRAATKPRNDEVRPKEETSVEARPARYTVAETNTDRPLQKSPVDFQIYYDGQLQPIQTHADGTSDVDSPRDGQQVHLYIKNHGTETYGVVVKVNGENTLRRQKLPSAECSMWVLGPDEGVTIRGYQMADDRMEKFVVVPPTASEEDALRYDKHAGTFSIEVFPERKKGDAGPRARGPGRPNGHRRWAVPPRGAAAAAQDLAGEVAEFARANDRPGCQPRRQPPRRHQGGRRRGQHHGASAV
jgi:hypothetical protein